MLTLFRVGPSICFSSDSLVRRFTHVEPSFSLVSDKISLNLKTLFARVRFRSEQFRQIQSRSDSPLALPTHVREEVSNLEKSSSSANLSRIFSLAQGCRLIHCNIFGNSNMNKRFDWNTYKLSVTRKVFDRSAHKTHD